MRGSPRPARDGAGRRRQHRQPADPRQPARERGAPGDHRHRRPRRDRCSPRSHRPDVIFMDVKMADLDGFSATRRLAADASDGAHSGDRGHRERVRRHAAGGEGGRLRRLPAQAGAGRGAVRGTADASRPRVRQRASSHAPPGDVRPWPTPVRDATLAARLRDAVAIGAVTDLEAIAEELAGGDRDARQRWGSGSRALAANFDFDGVRELAASLRRCDAGADAAD